LSMVYFASNCKITQLPSMPCVLWATGLYSAPGKADSQMAHVVNKKAKMQNHRGNSCGLQLTADRRQSYKHSITVTLQIHSLHSMVAGGEEPKPQSKQHLTCSA